MKTTVRTLLRGSVAASMAIGATLAASPASANCLVDFDDFDALSFLHLQARSTFAVESGGLDGSIVACEDSEVPCWMYQQACLRFGGGVNHINVDDASGYGHYHLDFTGWGFDPCIGNFVNPDGQGFGFSKMVNGQCVAPNWAAEPRKLDTHDRQQWIRIWNGWMDLPGGPFVMPKITVGEEPIELWYHRVDGQWFVYNSLGANTTWTLSGDSVTEVYIKAATEESLGSYTIHSFEIAGP